MCGVGMRDRALNVAWAESAGGWRHYQAAVVRSSDWLTEEPMG